MCIRDRNIAAQYLYLKQNPNADFIPKTYIFGAKAAPGYYMAKQMIRMICKLGDLINNDPAVRDKLRVVYLEEYCVSLSAVSYTHLAGHPVLPGAARSRHCRG